MVKATLEARIEALEKQVREQRQELTRLDDIEAIKKLQKAYGYRGAHDVPGDRRLLCR